MMFSQWPHAKAKHLFQTIGGLAAVFVSLPSVECPGFQARMGVLS
jgi:hypothetical protein